nr:MAG TPA: hypothetical protein [Caudoviricetes sp.]
MISVGAQLESRSFQLGFLSLFMRLSLLHLQPTAP